MKITNTKFSGLKVLNGIKFDDSRVYFREIYLQKIFKKKRFIFWCMSKSKKNVYVVCTFKQKIRRQKQFL